MANRPCYIVNLKNINNLVIQENIDFKFFSGFAKSQKQNSIVSLHESIKNQVGFDVKILEISSKSLQELGKKLSAFNLEIDIKGIKASVECVCQGSKVFEFGGPFTMLYKMQSIDAKRFDRLKTSGNLDYFDLFGEIWELEPKSAFYDWIYINALHQNNDLAKEIIRYDIFTDIEFNPKKSYSNQAKAAALYVAMHKLNLLDIALKSQNDFLSILKLQTIQDNIYFKDMK
ncbi:hypothetical protein GO117_06140 [Campylobacter fetus]|nr:hypothetical protein [Campylobacter fetus]EJU9540717.1 hypothetical protein [Campylobacter fetus]